MAKKNYQHSQFVMRVEVLNYLYSKFRNTQNQSIKINVKEYK